MTLTLAGVVVVMLAGLSSCSDNPTQPKATTGRLQVYMVDAPAMYENLEALTVIFGEVKVHASADAEGENEGAEAGWITVMSDTLPETERTFDLLELVGGVSALLGDVELPAGHYTQLRILIDSATVTIDGLTVPLKIPSGAQSGLKLVGGWDIIPDVVTKLTLDFDAAKSLKETPPGSGNFKFKPTIRMVQTDLTGSISGAVAPPGTGAVVNAYGAVSDTLVTSTYVDDANAYVLQALPPGVYNVEAFAAGFDTVRVEDVDVEALKDTGGVDFVLTPLN
jgi:hypothetical protein